MPGRLVFQQHVVVTLERHEARSGNGGCEEPSFFERHTLIAFGVARTALVIAEIGETRREGICVVRQTGLVWS
jgi:predicted transglutaminase-like cysteine proteinase